MKHLRLCDCKSRKGGLERLLAGLHVGVGEHFQNLHTCAPGSGIGEHAIRLIFICCFLIIMYTWETKTVALLVIQDI